MGFGTDIIVNRLKAVEWETQSQTTVDAERTVVRELKARIPGLLPAMKNMMREQLLGPAGHAADDIAKRMFTHYLDDAGQLFVLTLDDMKAMNKPDKRMNPKGIDIRNTDTATVNPAFAKACGGAKASGTPQDYTGHMLWVWDNGAISTYTINYAGKVTATGGVCTWTGTVDFFDRFDLDPRWGWSPSNTQGRSQGGERRTRIGYIGDVGTDFDVKSPKANVSQKDTDSVITFDGTIVTGSTPVSTP